MPIFEYRCVPCGERFETLQSHSVQAAPHCPRCGAERVERLLSSFAVLTQQRPEPATGPCGSPDCACRRS